MNIQDVLKKFDFSDKEIDTYLALFELGPSVVSSLAKKTGINRSTTYVILEALEKRGVVSTTERRGVKMYHPLPAEQLAKRFEDLAKQYSELAIIAKKLLPKLSTKFAMKSQKPTMRFFIGSADTNEVFANVLQSLGAIRGANLSGAKTKLSPGVNIYEDRVIFVSPNKDSGLVIESPEVANALKKAFGTA